jgi:hypothetical protein
MIYRIDEKQTTYILAMILWRALCCHWLNAFSYNLHMPSTFFTSVHRTSRMARMSSANKSEARNRNPDGTQRAVHRAASHGQCRGGCPCRRRCYCQRQRLAFSTPVRGSWQDRQQDVRPLPLSSLVRCSSLHLAILIRISPC